MQNAHSPASPNAMASPARVGSRPVGREAPRAWAPRLGCPPLTADDIAAILELLCEGFPRLPRQHWHAALDLLRRRDIPDGTSRYGYLVESDEKAVGVLLAITSAFDRNGRATIRSNSSSWYVRPEFRAFAGLMLSGWLRSPADTYLNVFPAEHTFAIIEQRGFVRFTNGMAMALPAAVWRGGGARVLAVDRLAEARFPVTAEDRRLLLDHWAAGCVAFWCEDRVGGRPFVFRRRWLKSRLPCAQLIYCHDIRDLTRFARAVGRHLWRHGLPVVLVAGNARVRGIPGIFINNKYPMYCRGEPPRIGDLAYTEAGLFGF